MSRERTDWFKVTPEVGCGECQLRLVPRGLRQAPGPRRTRKSRGDLAGLLASLLHSFLLTCGMVAFQGRRYRCGGAAGRSCPGPGRLEVPGPRFPRAVSGWAGSGRAGRLMSCEKRADGLSEHTWSQISPCDPAVSSGAAGLGSTAGKRLRGGDRRHPALSRGPARCRRSPHPGPLVRLLGRAGEPGQLPIKASGLRETAAQEVRGRGERGRLSWESISFVFIYECGRGVRMGGLTVLSIHHSSQVWAPCLGILTL